MATAGTTYTVRAQRSGDWWALDVAQVPGAYSQVKRLEQADEVAREAIGLLLDVDPNSFNVEVQAVIGDPTIDAAIASVHESFAEAKRVADAAFRERADLTVALNRVGLPMRDIGALLGVSHQRVAQLLASTDLDAPRTRRPRETDRGSRGRRS